MSDKLKILILYRTTNQYPMLVTLKDHIYSFDKYSNARCFYLNIAINKIPPYLLKMQFDLIIFHNTLLSCRFGGDKYCNWVLKRLALIKGLSAVKVAIVQDEYLNTDFLCYFINKFGIRHVFSLAPSNEWRKIYSDVDFEKVQFHQVLTGYLNDATLKRIQKLSQYSKNRVIDIGYRASPEIKHLGRHGLLKSQIAYKFQEACKELDLKTDISVKGKDIFLGDKWYEFMLKCKYIIGVEGGSSVFDKDGTIKTKTEEFLRKYPTALFSDIEKACFPKKDGQLKYFSISPRHLEACATKTCQVLVEGEYNGILKAGVHYIELKRDFSNIDETLKIIKQDSMREKITERAYQDIVESRKYTYQKFVNIILEKSMKNIKHLPETFWTNLIWRWIKIKDMISWAKVAVICTLYHKPVSNLPIPVHDFFQVFKNKIISRY